MYYTIYTICYIYYICNLHIHVLLLCCTYLYAIYNTLYMSSICICVHLLYCIHQYVSYMIYISHLYAYTYIYAVQVYVIYIYFLIVFLPPLKCKLHEETSFVLFTVIFPKLIIGSETQQTLNQYLKKGGNRKREKGRKDGRERGKRGEKEREVDSCFQPIVT